MSDISLYGKNGRSMYIEDAIVFYSCEIQRKYKEKEGNSVETTKMGI